MTFYIDPGTGSMLFTILVGILGAAVYGLRGAAVKLRFLFSGGKADKEERSGNSLVIYSDSKRYWNIFGPVCRELDRRGKKTVYMTSSPDDPALTEDFRNVRCEFIGEGNRAFAKLNMMKADVLLSTTPGLDVYQWKRSKDIKWYVHIPHMVSDITIYRMFGLDFYDAVLLTGSYQGDQIRQIEALRNLPRKQLQVVGLPYMDELLKRKEQLGPVEEHPRTVLLAPSWGKSSIFNRYGEKIFDALLATGYHIIVRPHPQSYTSEQELLQRLKTAYPDSERLEWNADNDNFQVLRRSDIMISDFSGVMFDFALVFDKPVIYADTTFDSAPYDCCWLEEETWTFSTLPKIGRKLNAEDLSHIGKVIEDTISDQSFQQGRDSARKESWQYIGESAKRIADYLIGKCEELADSRKGEQ